MNRIICFLIGLAVVGPASAEEASPGSPAAEAKTIQPAAPVKTPAEKLYVQAVAERSDGKPKQAIQTVAKVITLHADESDWLAKSELLSAELYLELGLTNAADVTARQVDILHQGTESAEKANALRSMIKKSRITNNGGK